MHILSYVRNKYTLPCKQDFDTNVNVEKKSCRRLGKIPTHPPLYCNEEEFEGFKKRKFKL